MEWKERRVCARAVNGSRSDQSSVDGIVGKRGQSQQETRQQVR